MTAAGKRLIQAAREARAEAGFAATINLPFPVSVNAMYRRTKRGVFLSDRYRAWKREAGYLLNRQNPPRFSGLVTIHLALSAPDELRRDSDNLTKGVLDLLVAHGVIADDSRDFVKWSQPEWVEGAEHPCIVTIQKAAA